MTNEKTTKEKMIDAQNKKLGRVATLIASMLMGKDRTDFVKNAIPDVRVVVINTSKLDITAKKKAQTTYTTYSGYPGGIKTKNMKKVESDKGLKEALRIAVKGMLPKNKLRDRMMKNLIITE